MSEFEIKRSAETPPPDRNVGASGETDADSGGGMSFVFHGRPHFTGKESSDQEKKHRPPPPVKPPVNLDLSPAAVLDMTGNVPPDCGSIGGKVAPPAMLADRIRDAVLAMDRIEEGRASIKEDNPSGPGKQSGKNLNITA